MKRLVAIFSILIVLCGCSFEELRGDFRPTGHEAFSIEQAKEFFEKDFAAQMTRSDGKVFRGGLHSGEFTPLWDKAVYSEADGVAAYDVDILADRGPCNCFNRI